jgi:hypothetical protein
MKLEKLFHVLVVTGAAATVGLVGCGDDDEGDNDNVGGASPGGSNASGGTGGARGGTTATGGTSGGSGGAAADMCEDMCAPHQNVDSWIVCDGCCCWLAVGRTSGDPVPICPEEPCCDGRGR